MEHVQHVWQGAFLTGAVTCARCGLMPLDADDAAIPCTTRKDAPRVSQIMTVAVSELRIGDRIDLEGDIFADKHGGEPCDCGDHVCASTMFPFELAVVEAIERDTAPYIRVDTQLGSFGFPPGHRVMVERD